MSSKRKIKNVLEKALLYEREMEFELYKYELAEHIDYWRDGLKKDGEEFVFVLTEKNGDTAMLLLTNKDELYINEEARNKLKTRWKDAYKKNIELLLPAMAGDLADGILSVNGVRYKK